MEIYSEMTNYGQKLADGRLILNSDVPAKTYDIEYKNVIT